MPPIMTAFVLPYQIGMFIAPISTLTSLQVDCVGANCRYATVRRDYVSLPIVVIGLP